MNEILLKDLNTIRENKLHDEVVYDFLCTYYDKYIPTVSEEDFFPGELTLPLGDRPSGILEAIQWFVDQGCNLREGPLMMSVGFADAEMTSFLIRHGADATYWPDMDEDPEYMRQNYYLEDIDIAYFDEHWEISEEYVHALFNTAKVLLTEGNTGSFFGLCLSADAEKREIRLSGPQWRY